MKKIFVIALTLFSLLVCSCSGFAFNNYTQYFVEGTFFGDSYDINHNKTVDAAILVINNISKEDFLNANGIDVVEDYNGGDKPYFLISLQIKINDRFDDFHFENLILKKYGGMCWYSDKNSNVITPEQQLNDDVPNDLYYAISYHLPDNVTNQTYLNIVFNRKKE